MEVDRPPTVPVVCVERAIAESRTGRDKSRLAEAPKPCVQNRSDGRGDDPAVGFGPGIPAMGKNSGSRRVLPEDREVRDAGREV